MKSVLIKYKKGFGRIKHINHNASLNKVLIKGHPIFTDPSKDIYEDYICQMKKCFKKAHVDITSYYIYPYDSWTNRQLPDGLKLICSITVDFEIVLKSNFKELQEKIKCCKNKKFRTTELDMIEAITSFTKRITKKLKNNSGERTQKLHSYFEHMLFSNPLSMDEAIQKILFFDALFWQAYHWHIGLGRLDKILYKYYTHDIDRGVIDRNKAKQMIYEMCKMLSRDMVAKSKTLLGDTGQYILLGGINETGNIIQNELTEIFLEIFTEYKFPDPKLILRVNEHTSDKIWEKTVKCLITGNGSPLIMNESLIIDNMVRFGYSQSDISQVGTSACWEPLIIGKSFDQNNPLPSIISMNSLNKTIFEYIGENKFNDFLYAYKKNLADDIHNYICDINFDCSPLFTLFFNDCIEKEKDFAHGGARYNYHGTQVVSFPNTINALLNIKYYVFEKQILSLQQCRTALQNNFEGFEDIRILMAQGALKYGSTNTEVVNLTNDLMSFIGDEIKKNTINGNPIKIGFSSPNYIMSSTNTCASLDGRKAGDPFAVHISPLSSEIDIAEIMDFATKLNYEDNRINGNVVDFTIPASYIQSPTKLENLIKNACNRGIFELQLNVLNYKQLVDAKLHPEKYPNLIVRVWGFSAYFNDLPNEYKDNLIERAKLYEWS